MKGFSVARPGKLSPLADKLCKGRVRRDVRDASNLGCKKRRPVLMPRFPRLLLIGNFLSFAGGSRSVIEDLAERLPDSGRAPICVSSFHSAWIRGIHMLSTATFRRLEYEVAVVDLYSGRAFIWGEALSLLLKALRCPFVLVLRGGALPHFARRHPARVKGCLSRAAAVIAPSRYLAEELRSYRTDLRLLPNPLTLGAYRFRHRERARPDLVWLRAFHEIYNPLLAVKVAGLLARDFPHVCLTMIGPDKNDGSLQRLQRFAAEIGFAEQIILPGGVPKGDVPSWLKKGDIFLNTTNVDNVPVSVLEAMACGLCVVSTDAGGIPHLLEHERDALLVPVGDPEAMAIAVRRLLTEPGLAERLSYNARQKVEQFDWSMVLPHWRALLISAAEGKRYE